MNMAVLMDHARVKLEENNMVNIQLESQMEVHMFRDASQELRLFLAEAMDNNSFELQFAVLEGQKENHRPYTTMEKYKKMEELNPSIRALRDQLGLELDM
jgi:hypothetical protein